MLAIRQIHRGSPAPEPLPLRDGADRLRANPSFDTNAIEELLRWDPPVQFTRGITAEPVDVEGETMPTGTVVALGLVRGNRDPEKWGTE